MRISNGVNTVAVIPAYNEERFIGSVVLQTRSLVDAVIVVDDGSTDNTAEIARAAGAIVLRHERNQGKGKALRTGLQAARHLYPRAVVLLDGDGQHLPSEISAVLAPVLAGEADMVVGSRYLNNHSRVPRARVWGHRVFNFLTHRASGVYLTDSQNGFRAFSAHVLDALNFHSNGFSVESEMQLLAQQHGWRVKEVPVTVLYAGKPKRSAFLQGLMVLDGFLRFVGQHRPLLTFTLMGSILLLTGMGWGFCVVEIYRRTQLLAIGYALLCVMLTILGSICISTGFIIHSLRGLILSMTHNTD